MANETAPRDGQIWRVIDIESSGVDPKVDDIIELGWRDIAFEKSGPVLAPWFEETFVKTDKTAFDPENASIHHILPEDLAVAPARMFAVNRIMGAAGYVAHNADFELSFIPEIASAPVVCTYKCALRVWPDLARHNNQFLRYHLGVATSREERDRLRPHRAGDDAYVAAPIFLKLLKEQPLEQLTLWSLLPPRFTKFGFGKHKGEALADVPESYFGWMDGEDFDDGVRHTVACERARRKEGDHELYFQLADQVVETAGSVEALEDWWKREADHRAQHHVVRGTILYDRLIARCAAWKQRLKEASQ